MPNINLRDKRNRDALVRADSVKQTAIVRYVDKDGAQPKLRHVLRATAEHGVETLLARPVAMMPSSRPCSLLATPTSISNASACS